MGVTSLIKRVFNISTGDEKDMRLTLQGGDWGSVGQGIGPSMPIDRALQLSAFWACVQKTAQAISTMPLHVYDKRPDGGRDRIDSDISDVLTRSPNADQTALEFWEGMVAWMLVQGNGYAEISRIGDRVTALHPLRADRMRVFRDARGELRYQYHDRGRYEDLPRRNVFHLKGFSFGQDEGLSAIQHGAASMIGAYETEKSAREIFANRLKASGVLSVDETLKGDQRKELMAWINEFSKSENKGGLLPLPVEMKYQQLSMNPEDAEMLASRRFNIEEICRWFGIPPIVIGHAAEGQTMWGSGVEQILLAWLGTGLNPQLRRIEARIKKQLISKRSHYAEFNREALLQMDSQAKAEFISTLVTAGVMKPDEGRRVLNFEKAANGDQLYMQGAMVPLGSVGKE